MKARAQKSEKNTKNNSKKIIIKNKKKFIIFVTIAVICIIVIVCLILSSLKVKIDDNTNISELNIKKYGEEIKEQYEIQGKDLIFMKDWNNVQDSVGRYLIENYPADNTQLTAFINSINDILNTTNWEKLNVNRPTSWNGYWSIDENGNVNFKFASKEIEPNWASTLSDQGYIILN